MATAIVIPFSQRTVSRRTIDIAPKSARPDLQHVLDMLGSLDPALMARLSQSAGIAAAGPLVSLTGVSSSRLAQPSPQDDLHGDQHVDLHGDLHGDRLEDRLGDLADLQMPGTFKHARSAPGRAKTRAPDSDEGLPCPPPPANDQPHLPRRNSAPRARALTALIFPDRPTHLLTCRLGASELVMCLS